MRKRVRPCRAHEAMRKRRPFKMLSYIVRRDIIGKNSFIIVIMYRYCTLHALAFTTVLLWNIMRFMTDQVRPSQTFKCLVK